MMNQFVFTCLFLLFALLCIGCYTQLGAYEAPRPVRQEAHNRRSQEKVADESGQGEQKPVETTKPKANVEAEANVEDEGYYGHRRPSSDAHTPYDDPYYIWDAYGPQPYLPYPYYDYYAPYEYHYPYGYYGHHYYPDYGGYPRRYDRGDIDYSRRRRQQSYQGHHSGRSSSERPRRSTATGESNRPPAANSSKSSDSRLQKMRRSERRH